MNQATYLNISDYMFKMRDVIEKRLDVLVSEQQAPYNLLFQAARYSLLNGGKRLRPLLTLGVTHTLMDSNRLTQDSTIALDSACAIEMVHTYSLIHDDLPCMDDDDFRRGKPCLHKVYGEAAAVLAGDYLLTKAFEVIASDPHLSDKQKVDVSLCLSRNAGDSGMVAGQIMDIATDHRIDLAQLEMVHCYKTGALITAAIEIGAIISHASLNQINHLRQFGNAIGLSFQIIDDILDVTKNRNSDLANNKTTYMTLLGKDKAEDTVKKLLSQANESLKACQCETHLLSQLTDQLIGHF